MREMPQPQHLDIDEWIRRLDLQPHPEGGYYRETYRSPLLVRPGTDPFAESVPVRSASTAIYYMLTRGQFSALHRIRSDEGWHFYAGSSLLVTALLPDPSRVAAVETYRLGQDYSSGDLPQCIVPAGAWFGAELAGDGDYALVGCTVAPGFDFGDFEMGNRAALLSQYPQYAALIRRLTR
jgi:predicted cupin superfamily sugar epimerase